MVSPLESAVNLLRDFGFFNIVLPFLLVFAIVFAVLEKTRIFGAEEVEGKAIPRRNIDAMVAFVLAFFFIAATNLVAVIQELLPQITFVLVAILCFMLLIGMFFPEGKFEISGTIRTVLIVIILLVVLALLLNVFGWLTPVFDFFKRLWGTAVFSTIIFLIIIAIAIWAITRGGPKGGSTSGEEEEKE